MIGIATVTVGDLDEAMREAIAQVKGGVDNLLSETATFIRDDAQRTSDFIDRSGNLRKSIRKRKSKFIDGGYIVSASGRNRSDEKGFHAWLVEFGHVKVLLGRRTSDRVKARPFMRKAKAKGLAHIMSKVVNG